MRTAPCPGAAHSVPTLTPKGHSLKWMSVLLRPPLGSLAGETRQRTRAALPLEQPPLAPIPFPLLLSRRPGLQLLNPKGPQGWQPGEGWAAAARPRQRPDPAARPLVSDFAEGEAAPPGLSCRFSTLGPSSFTLPRRHLGSCCDIFPVGSPEPTHHRLAWGRPATGQVPFLVAPRPAAHSQEAQGSAEVVPVQGQKPENCVLGQEETGAPFQQSRAALPCVPVPPRPSAWVVPARVRAVAWTRPGSREDLAASQAS